MMTKAIVFSNVLSLMISLRNKLHQEIFFCHYKEIIFGGLECFSNFLFTYITSFLDLYRFNKGNQEVMVVFTPIHLVSELH